MKNLIKKLLIKFEIIKPRKMIDALFASYTALIIVPIVILGMFFTVMSSYQFTEFAKNNDAYIIGDLADTIDEEMNKIFAVTYRIMKDDNVIKFDSYDEYSFESAQTMKQVKKVLSDSIIESDIIEDIYLYYKRSGTVLLSNSAKYDYEYLTSKFNVTDEELFGMLESKNGSIFSVNQGEGDEAQRDIIYVKSVDKMFGSGEIYSIFILSDDFLAEKMESANYDDRGSILFLTDEGEVLLSKGSEEISAHFENDGEILHDIKRGEQFTEIKKDGKRLCFFMKQIPACNTYFLWGFDSGHYSIMSNYIWITILLVCLFIICIGVFVAKIYSRRIYRPIKNIMDFFKPQKEEYGKKSELEFLESKFAEIMQLQKKMEGQKDVHSIYYIDKLFYNFLKGYASDEKAFRTALGEYGICFEHSFYTPVLIRVDRLRSILKNIQMPDFLRFVRENIGKAFEKDSFSEKVCIYDFYDSEYIGMIIASDFTPDFEKLFNKVQKEIYQKLEISLSAGVGESVENVSKLPEEYASLTKDMEEMKLFGMGFFFSGRIKNDDSVYEEGFYNFKEKIIPLMLKNNKDELKKEIYNIFLSGAKSYKMLVRLFNSFTVTLIGFVNGGEYSSNFKKDAEFSDIDAFLTAKEIAEYFYRVCTDISASIEESEENRDKMYEKFMEYINENYMNQIDLQTISEHFGYSKGYFSRYFKKIMGKNYIEMLNQLRIEKAKKLISENQCSKLLDVAESVGFISYKTFSEAFKKYEKCSPESFKNGIM